MAIPQNPNVYMETMEETENQGEEPAENGSAGRFGMMNILFWEIIVIIVRTAVTQVWES